MERTKWKPRRFRFGRWGVGTSTSFLVSKLLDWKDRWEELEQSDNPFAVAVMAHLKTMETRQNPEERAEWRFRFVRRRYEGGFSWELVEEMLRFLDWIMALPEELERQYNERIAEYEKEQAMEYVTSWERNGIKKGALQSTREDILDVLDARFGAVDPSVSEAINHIDDLETLKHMLRRRVLVAGPEEVLEEARVHAS